MPKVRVLVVEDSITVRERICEVLRADPDVEVVGAVGDGPRAIDLCLELRPDVLTLDMILPRLGGLAATEYLMAHCPTPILIVSSSVNRGELVDTCEALAAGAVDVLEKPRGDEPSGEWERRFVSTVKLVSRIKVITHPRARLASYGRATSHPLSQQPPIFHATAPPSTGYRVAAIGASTGGPAAITQILRSIPAALPVPIVIVLHIGEPFGRAFASWLDDQTHHRVAYARDGEPLASIAGRVVLAPPDRHLFLEGGKLRLGDGPERHSCRPSIDILFEAIARDCGAAAMACLLTGMGRDGAAGLLEIRRAGGFTIAQDEATSVVWGMPREAVLLSAAERVLPLGDIGRAITEATRAPQTRQPERKAP
jgi:two-component system, chemotaxis family, protein-glutamate methylesterase/glutaminase